MNEFSKTENAFFVVGLVVIGLVCAYLTSVLVP